MPRNSEHTPVKDRKGIKITGEIRELYKNRVTSHDNDPDYHKLVASGLLWSCGKLADDGQPAAGYAAPAPKK